MKIKVGDKIRSYDFEPHIEGEEGREECYCEGIVTKMDVSRSLIFFTITKRVWRGMSENIKNLNEEYSTPMLGFTREYEGRLTILNAVTE